MWIRSVSGSTTIDLSPWPYRYRSRSISANTLFIMKIGHIYRPQGKAMFSQASVCPTGGGECFSGPMSFGGGRYMGVWGMRGMLSRG